MKEEHFQHVTKSGHERIKELYYALRIITDSRALIFKGHYYQISVIYGQLRSLLTERSKKMSPLLFEVASFMEKELEIYHIPDTFEEDAPQFTEGMTFRISSNSPSRYKSHPKHIKIALSEYLEIDLLTYKGRKFKLKRIIEELANRYGGAHYSRTTHRYLYEMLSIGFNGQPMLNQFVIQLSDLTTDLGISLLKTVTDIDFYIHFYLTEKKVKGDIFLFDYQLPNNPNRFSLILNHGRLHFLIVDSFGNDHLISAEQPIEYGKMQLVDVSVEVTKTYKSRIKIYVEENLVAELTTDVPLLTINELEVFDAYFNKQVGGNDQEYEFGMGEIFIFGKIPNHFDKLEVYDYFYSKEYKDILWLGEKVYGRKKPNERNINLSKKIQRKKISISPETNNKTES